MQAEQIYIENVEKIVHGGFGFGHLNSGQVVFVAGALPDEALIVTIRQKKKNHLFGEIAEIVQPNLHRITPLCPHKLCGGCDLQHTIYKNQLVIKEMVMSDLLSRQGKEDFVTEVVAVRQPILPAEKEFFYRQRIRLQVKEGRIGFLGRNSHDFVEIRQCRLAREKLNVVLDCLQKEEMGKLLASAEELELLENPQDGKVVLLLHLIRSPRPDERKQAKILVKKIPQISRVFFIGKNFALDGPYPEHSAKKSLAYEYEISSSTLHFGFEVGGFCQVNLAQNKKLIALVCKLAAARKGEKILDLYCGMGNFALPLAASGAEVLGIEAQGSAIRSAKSNAKRANLPAYFEKSPVEDACRKLAGQKKYFDTVIIDPPRRGIPQLAGILAQLAIRKLIYISCEPATLMRDLLDLRQSGFRITAFQPVDMFPQTHHIETVVQLEKPC